MEIDVVLPCLDEEEALPVVLGRMPYGYRPIVVDNGSTDGSARVASELGARVVSEPHRGFGAACHAGLMAATGDVVCFMDADASLDPGQLPRVAAPVLAGRSDLVLGRRRLQAGATWPVHARIGNAVLAGRLRRRTGVALHDLGPMRACRRADLLALGLVDRRFGYPLEMVLRAATAGWRISEVDVDYLPRTGRSKVTGTLRGTLRAIGDMRRVLAEQRPTGRGGAGHHGRVGQETEPHGVEPGRPDRGGVERDRGQRDTVERGRVGQGAEPDGVQPGAPDRGTVDRGRVERGTEPDGVEGGQIGRGGAERGGTG